MSNRKTPYVSGERGVSPVIGVILMVAITVILAAVIGTFVLGLGDQVQQTAPNAQISGEQVEVGSEGNEENALRITHESGEAIDISSISITVDGEQTYAPDDGEDTGTDNFDVVTAEGAWSDSEATAGNSVLVVGYTDDELADNNFDDGEMNNLTDDNEVRITWRAPDGDRTATLFTREIE